MHKKLKLFGLIFLAASAFSLSTPLSFAEKNYSAGDVSFSVGMPWAETPASSPMRKFQFAYPRAEGDSSDGELAVFYFGENQGGSVQSNIMRWTGQFKPAGGGEEKVEPDVTESSVNGLKVTVVKLKGMYAPENMMGSGPHEAKDNYGFLCAIAEGPKGPVFFRMIGPEKTVEAAKPAFEELVQSFKS